MVNPMDVGDGIKNKRMEAEISARSLSKALGKSPTYVSKVESGEIHLSFQAFSEIAVALGMSGIEILFLVKEAATNAGVR